MIYVAAGHHALARGAAWKGFVEHDEALLWQAALCRHAPNAFPVPSSPLEKKVAWINDRASRTDLAIDIHFNAGNPAAHGSETLYCPGSSRGMYLARLVQDALAAIFRPDRGIKEGWYRMDRPGWVDFPGDVDGNEKPDFFLKATRCTALIIEPDFVYRAQHIRSMRDACCHGLAKALEKL